MILCYNMCAAHIVTLRILVSAFTAENQALSFPQRGITYIGLDLNPIMNTNHHFSSTFTYKIPGNAANMTVADFLFSMGLSARLLAKLRSMPGSFLLDGHPVFSNCRLIGGETLILTLTEPKTSDSIEPVALPLNILYEDEHLAVINKAAGMPVHPSHRNHGNTLANAMAWKRLTEQKPFVFRAVNRLDKDTSGILLLAHDMLTAGLLADQVASNRIHREYLALASGLTDPSGTITVPIGRKPGSAIERIPDPENGAPAVTHYRRLGYNKNADLSLLALRLTTGRTHQIRVHMSYIGHPLPGDFLYNPDYRHIRRQALHSHLIRFMHPITGESMEFSAPLPEDMGKFFPAINLPAPF